MFTICSAVPLHVPQSSVLGHGLGAGFVSGSQLEVLHETEPGEPDAPAATPHLIAHSAGSPCTQSPGGVDES